MPCPRRSAGLTENACEGSARTYTQAAAGLPARSRQPRHQAEDCNPALGRRSSRRPYAAAPKLALVYVVLNLATILAVLGWFVACWGAFRQLHSIARRRSALAGVLTLVAGVIFFSGLQYILLGMFGSRVPPLR